MRITLRLFAGIAALLLAAPGGAVAGSDAPPAKGCVAAQEDSARSAGDSAGSGPVFTHAFSARTITLEVSLDGMDGKQLPLSIEMVCGIPKALTKQAMQLPGNDGVGLLSSGTKVYAGSTRVRGAAVAAAIDGADTAVLRVRLVDQRRWAADEDGNKVPTFAVKRITITD